MYSTHNSFPSHNFLLCRNVTPVYAEVKGKLTAAVALRFARHNSISSWQTGPPARQLKGVFQFGIDVAAKCDVWNSAPPPPPLGFFLI